MKQQLIGAAALVAVASTFAAAQSPGPGWDWHHPTNIAESRQFAAALFQSQDTGQPMAPFQFTNPPPELMELMFLPQRVLFQYLYSHRLQLNPGLPNYYPFESLVQDDVWVRDSYRQCVLTGVVKTSIIVDDEASFKHLAAILESFFDSPSQYIQTCGTWAVENQTVESQCNAIQVPAPAAPAPYTQSPTPPELVEFEAHLRYEVHNSMLPCMSGRGLWKADGGPNQTDTTQPGLDCDDIARMMEAWLQWHLCVPNGPSWRLSQLAVYWHCPGDPPDGHAIPIVHVGGYYYLIDPQTGRIVGPIPEGTTPIGPAMNPGPAPAPLPGTEAPDESWLIPNCPIIEWEEKPSPTDRRDYPYEPDPWWKDRDLDPSNPEKGNIELDMWARFDHFLNASCNNPCGYLSGLTAPTISADCLNIYGPFPCNSMDQYLARWPNWRDAIPNMPYP